MLNKMLNKVRDFSHKIPPNLSYVDRKKVKAAVMSVNKIIPLFVTGTITGTNGVLSTVML